MAPHHEDRERHGSHLPTEFREVEERFHSEETAERLEMDRSAAKPLSWFTIKEVVVLIVPMLSAILAGCATYYGVVGTVQDSRKDIEALTARVVIIERGRAENIPRLEEQVRLNSQQELRIQNQTEANGRTATALNDLGRQVDGQGRDIADLRVKQAVLEERIGHGGPHDR